MLHKTKEGMILLHNCLIVTVKRSRPSDGESFKGGLQVPGVEPRTSLYNVECMWKLDQVLLQQALAQLDKRYKWLAQELVEHGEALRYALQRVHDMHTQATVVEEQYTEWLHNQAWEHALQIQTQWNAQKEDTNPFVDPRR